MLLERVLKTIETEFLLSQGDNVIVALSGGADSVALLLALKKISKYNLYALHMNHLMRGESATRDENFCISLCEVHGVPLRVIRKDVRAYASENGIGEELAGRELRHAVLKEFALEINAYVATAHHEDDLCESFLLNIIRGTGMDGLSSIPYKNHPFVRPFLDVKRKQIIEFLRDESQDFVTDETNLENNYKRNRIRNIIIPELQRLDLDITKNLPSLIRKAKEDKEFFEQYVSKIIDDRDIIPMDELLNLHISISSRVVREMYRKITGNIMDFSSKQVMQVLSLKRSGSYVVVGDVRFSNDFGNLTLSTSPKEKKVDIQKVNCWDRADSDAVFIDADKVKGNLRVRFRQNGDRFRPIGGRMKKLKDYLIEVRIPRNERDVLPLVVDDEKIVWVAGHRISEDVKINSDSKNFYRLSINIKK